MKRRRSLLKLLFLTALGASIGILMSRPAVIAAAPKTPVSAETPLDYAPVEAFLKANCIDCHGPDKQKGDITLHTYHDSGSIVKDRKVWTTVLEKLRSGEMPPKKRPRPDKAEQDVFLRTIDQIFYRYDQTHPLDPGQVTIRRLNRTEYNNTIRDLCGVDAQPAEDFPSDDIGQGFDNIGDVLSMSPVLMERYLSAADTVMQRALSLEPPIQMKHSVAGRFLEPALNPPKLPENEHRSMTVKQPLFAHYTVNDEGEYGFQVTVFPDYSDDEGSPAEVVLMVDHEVKQRFQVSEGDRKHPLVREARFHLLPGDHRFEIAIERAWEDEPDWTLRVKNFELTGPPDARPANYRMLLKCDPHLSQHDKTRQILSRFATRAYRRPVTDQEVDHLMEFAEKVQADGGKWEAGIQLAMQAVLVSPKFLFRVELDDRPDAAGPHPIDEFQLASRLSYFIWSSMPDDELLELAGKNQLSVNLESQVRRMLRDPKSQALVDNFALQWLQLRRLQNFSPDASLYPAFNEKLRADMLTETRMFVGSVFQEDRSILDLIDADYTFLNEDLAKFYRIDDTNGNPKYQARIAPQGDRIPREQFVRVHLADSSRGGVLTEASVLAVTSNPTRTSPVKRGKFVLEQILGVPPPPPPPNVPQLPEIKTVGNGGTVRISLRQRMEQHRSDPNCANCHEHMDGIGFAFENYDAIGGFRSSEGGIDIDPSGTMPDGESFNGAAALKTILKQRTDLFSRCLTKKMLIYALGRGTEYYDQPAIDRIVSALKQNNYKFSTLLVGIAESDPFRMRRGKQ